MKKLEKRHLARVASLPCACCGSAGPSLVHHLRHSQGLSQKASTYLTIPLCHDCHQGPAGVHGDKSLMSVYKTSELNMLAAVVEKLAKKIDWLLYGD